MVQGRDELIHNLVHNAPNYLAWGQCLGPALLLWHLVVLLSQGPKNEEKITTSETQKLLIHPSLSYPITHFQLFQHDSVLHCAIVLGGASIMGCSLLILSFALSLPPSPNFTCEIVPPASSIFPSNTFPN